MYWQTKKELNMNELSQEIIDYVFSHGILLEKSLIKYIMTRSKF